MEFNLQVLIKIIVVFEKTKNFTNFGISNTIMNVKLWKMQINFEFSNLCQYHRQQLKYNNTEIP